MVDFNTPVGRIVWGNPAKPRIKKDQKTKQPVFRDGKQVEQWTFGLAIPKADFNAQVWPYLQQEAATLYPSGVPGQFSWKVKDGDGVDRNGKPYRDREGYAGCFVLAVTTEAFAPPIYKLENGAYRQLAANEIKCGDYVVVKLNVKANSPKDQTHTPGLYVNPVGINHVGYGQEIVGQEADPNEMFGATQYQLPPGATTAPQVQQGAAAPPFAAPAPAMQPAPVATQYQAPPAPAPMPTQGPAPFPPPAHDFVNNAGHGNPPAPAPFNNAPGPGGGFPPQMPGTGTGRFQ